MATWKQPPLLLRMMRKVASQAPEKDETDLEKRLRTLYTQDFKAFTAQLAGLEKHWVPQPKGDHEKQRARAKAKREPSEPDTVEKMIGDLLKELQA